MPRNIAWLVVAAMAATVAAYWTGLHGPFVLDDVYNFQPIDAWLQGRLSLRELLASGTSGTFGRPLAFASWALSARMGGFDPYAFKLGNLLAHLSCGGVLFALSRRMAALDPALRAGADRFALLVSAAWLLHPLNSSTVLYAVQRMAQLSAFAVVSGMWLYLAMRDRLAHPTGRSGATLAGLFLGVPLLAVAGFLSKETAIMLPALCLVLEIAYPARAPRPPALKAFFGVFLVLPVIAGLAAFASNPARLMGGYLMRDFSWQERVLTQARVLCDYLWKLVLPLPQRMGVYADDVAVSTGLLSPATTLLSIIALAAITIAAWRLRHRMPALLAGWGIFLVGHALESTLLPLELYYEHRNYLPSFGVVYALAGAGFAGWKALDARSGAPRRAGWVIVILVLAACTASTYGRARAWSSPESLAIDGVSGHPYSQRANMALVQVALDHGNIAAVDQALERLIASPFPRAQANAYLNRVYLGCVLNGDAQPEDLRRGVAAMPPRLTFGEPELFGLMLQGTAKGCGRITDAMLGQALDTMLDRASAQPDMMWPKWQLRYLAAQFFARAGNWPRAQEQAQLAWQPGTEPPVASLLISAQLANGDITGAERTWTEASARIDRRSQDDVAGLAWLRQRIDSARTDRQ